MFSVLCFSFLVSIIWDHKRRGFVCVEMKKTSLNSLTHTTKRKQQEKNTGGFVDLFLSFSFQERALRTLAEQTPTPLQQK